MNFNDFTTSKKKYLYAREQNLLLRARRERMLKQAAPQWGGDEERYTDNYPEPGEWMSILDVLNPSESSLRLLRQQDEAPLSNMNLRCVLCFDSMCAGDSDEEALRRVPSLFAQAKELIKSAKAKLVSNQASNYGPRYTLKEQKRTDVGYMVRRQTNDVLEVRLILANRASLLPEQLLRLLLPFAERFAEGNSVPENAYRLLFSGEPYQLRHTDGIFRTVHPPSYHLLDEETRRALDAIFD